MLLSVIIVSYNTKRLTTTAIKSVLEDIKPNPELVKQTEVIVIDNNSSDDSVSALKKLSKNSPCDLKVIENDKNLGFAGANNKGIKTAKGDLVFLLNSDTLIKPGAIAHLISCFKNYPVNERTADLSVSSDTDRLGLVAAQLLNEDGTIQPQGGKLPNLVSVFFHMTLLDDLPIIGKFLPSSQETGRHYHHQEQSSSLQPKDWVAATAVMIKKEVFDEIGQLDKSIFMYGEDMEFCLRAKKHHWDIALAPLAQVTHFGSKSSSPENAIKGELQAYLHIWSKHMPLWQLPFIRAMILLGSALRVIVFGTISPDPKKVKAYKQVLAQL